MPPEREKDKTDLPANVGTMDERPGTPSTSTEPTVNPNSESWRATTGSYMDSISDTINKHIVAARYGTMATVLLLSAYGLSQTPLFSRFRTVSDIPATYFVNRRIIYGRLIRVGDWNVADKPVQFLVFHLSPFGRLMSRPVFEFFVRTSPSATIGRKLEENTDELLKVEIAGVKLQSDYGSHNLERTREWLDQLSQQKAVVTCQLLARRVKQQQRENFKSSVYPVRASLVDSTAFRPEMAKNDVEDGLEQTAICKLSFRSSAFQVFPTDVAFAMVRWGYVSPSETLFSSSDVGGSRIMDASTQLNSSKADNQYMKQLERAEFEAAKENRGMWADSQVRERRSDLIEEVDFQTKASILKKLWRWLRG